MSVASHSLVSCGPRSSFSSSGGKSARQAESSVWASSSRAGVDGDHRRAALAAASLGRHALRHLAPPAGSPHRARCRRANGCRQSRASGAALAASMTCAASASGRVSLIFPFFNTHAPRTAGAPVPSTMVAFLISRSNKVKHLVPFTWILFKFQRNKSITSNHFFVCCL